MLNKIIKKKEYFGIVCNLCGSAPDYWFVKKIIIQKVQYR